MKRFLKISIVLLLFITTTSHTQIDYQMIRSNNYHLTEWTQLKGNNLEWINFLKGDLFYDENGNLIRVDYQNWDTTSSNWLNYHSDSLSYFDYGNSKLIEITKLHWDGYNYVNDTLITQYYNAIDSLSEEVVYLWDESSMSWQNSIKKDYQYGSDNLLKEILNYKGDGPNWFLYSKYTYAYDSNSNLIERAYQKLVYQWQNVSRRLYYYDNNKLTSYTYEQWENNDWVIGYQEYFTYDNNLLVERTLQLGGGLNNTKQVMSYNSNNYLSSVEEYFWIDTAWVNHTLKNNLYDLFGNLSESVTKIWRSNTWLNLWKEQYKYTLITDVNDILSISDYHLSNAFPNPFNPTTRIQFQIPNESFVSLVIFDALGREVDKIINEQMAGGTYEVNWNASNFSSGVYFYQLRAGDFIQTKKMILMK